MPLAAIWSLITALIVLALGLTLKLAGTSFALQLRDKQLDNIISKLKELERKK